MRLRKVKNAKERLTDGYYFIENPKDNKGKWSKVFGNYNPIHIEIGCGKGQFMYTLSKNNPDINYIAIEKYDSVLLRVLEKIKEENIPNLKICIIDANEISEYFGENELDRIYLNFSDPWPKSRHDKRRLTSPIFLKKYEQITTRPFEIEFKTDNRELFAYSIQTLNQAQYTILELTLDLHADQSDIVTTEYEDRFSSVGNPIYYVRVKNESIRRNNKSY